MIEQIDKESVDQALGTTFLVLSRFYFKLIHLFHVHLAQNLPCPYPASFSPSCCIEVAWLFLETQVRKLRKRQRRRLCEIPLGILPLLAGDAVFGQILRFHLANVIDVSFLSLSFSDLFGEERPFGRFLVAVLTEFLGVMVRQTLQSFFLGRLGHVDEL